VHHGLFVLWTEKLQTFLAAELNNALPQASDIAMTKNAPDSIDKSVFPTISFDELAGHEANDGLPGC
jgi:hypothetical protein